MSDEVPSNSRTSKDEEEWTVPSNSRTSKNEEEEEWTKVQTSKKEGRGSPILWDEIKVVIDRGCFKCGEKGHWSRECQNEWLCHRCGEHGHTAKYCPGKRWVPPKMVVVLPLETSQATSDTPADVHGPSSDQRPTVRVEDQAPRSEERPTSASTSRSSRAEHPAARRLAALKRTEEGEEKGAAGQKGQTFRRCPISWCRENFYKKGHIFGCHYPTALAKEDNPGSEERQARIIRVRAIAVDTPIQEEDGVSSTSVDSRQVVIPVLNESSTSIPRRPWLSGRSPEESVNLSDMEVVDEVTEEEPTVMEAPRRVHFAPVAPFRFESVDSHFHLDRLCARLGVRPVNYAEALRRVRSGSEEYFKPDGAVAVWCDPLTYPTKRQVSQLRKRRVVLVIGIHPGNVVEGDVKRLATMLDTYEVVGLGEVGLNGTKGDPELQRRTLDEALVLLKTRPHLVLVLHCCPGPRENITSAYYELFYRCKGILSPE
ncbi:hypothetical protein DPMN_128413 [Dreissena polymorpha]|uniref:CCHC-type domain-containing protein n=1 Tax=Dreissena polymorpha TaxID=45954 RepID=A0A9D4JZN2_DREPO|nr:hypothetical protein DPMN_128413 [Dreissena polymorpha]